MNVFTKHACATAIICVLNTCLNFTWVDYICNVTFKVLKGLPDSSGRKYHLKQFY